VHVRVRQLVTHVDDEGSKDDAGYLRSSVKVGTNGPPETKEAVHTHGDGNQVDEKAEKLCQVC